MGNLRKLKRGINIGRVHMAERVAYERIENAKKIVVERASKDAEFAADLIKAVGDNLPSNIKKVAEDCIIAATTRSLEGYDVLSSGSNDKAITKLVNWDSNKSESVFRDMPSDFNPEVTDKELNEVADEAIVAFSNDYPEIPAVNNSAESGKV